MSTDEKNTESDGPATNDGDGRIRLVLIAGCVLTVVLAAMLVPTLSTGGLAGTPIDSILPGERFDDGSGGGGSGGGSGFGALNPGEQTGVVGETGFDNETFGANDTSVHFEIESTVPAYWRTGSYDTYTGTGWERDSETTAFDPPLEPHGMTDGEADFEVTLSEPATAIPTAWQPRELSGATEVGVTEDGALRAVDPLQPGTTLSGVSQLQENDVEILRTAGEEYPADIDEQYTQLPDDTPERVEEFTDDLTADDDTPYETAVTVQNWLRNNKSYSLQANEQSDHIADTFIFEMDEGYCEYFATAMTTMLRSQDIPARYAVGYTTGQPIGDDTYEVRGMNAHAWVEVYFPDVGWVQFDPTPGDSRLDTQSTVLEDDLGEEFDLQEPGSPGEQFEPGAIRDQNDTDDGDENQSHGAFDISLNRTAVPGMPVEIEVTDDGEPVEGLTVTVNDEDVGTTDSDGTVVITVPDEEELEITVSFDDAVIEDVGDFVVDDDSWENETQFIPSNDEQEPTRIADGEETGVPSTADSPTGSTTTSTLDGHRALYSQSHESPLPAIAWNNETLPSVEPVTTDVYGIANTTVTVETDVTLTVSGDTLPGETVAVTASVGTVLIPDADVLLDGERVTATDENGQANVTLPGEAGETTLAVERGSVSGEETLTIPELELAVEIESLTLPFTTATASVTADDRSVADAPVFIDGEQVTTTDSDGTAEISLPARNTAVIETEMYGMGASETVDNLLVNLGVVVTGAVLAVALPAGILRRRETSPRGLVQWVGGWIRRGVTYTQRLLLAVVRYGGVWLAAAPSRLRTTLVYGFDALRGRVGVRELRTVLLSWLQAKHRRIRGVNADDDSPGSDGDVVSGIQRAWAQFLSHVSVTDPAAYTPGELAAHAVEVDGLPADPVETLLTAFREIEYGARPERDRLDRVERALSRIASRGDATEQHISSTDATEQSTDTERRERQRSELSADGGTATERAYGDGGRD